MLVEVQAEVAHRPANSAFILLLDFDGTLAEFNPDPAAPEGDAVVEYLPDIAGHKGDATQWISDHVQARTGRPAWVAYIGDDITDEDAFNAITSGISVLAGLRPTAATHKLNGIADVDQFLRWPVGRG